ncbi:MAG: YebC/PmpR family DNA-binding transcriptional regulator [Patescibacteria group bacterium]
MSGHSKWATTHRQKEIVDAKRGAIFTKFANVIAIAAKQGGDPSANPSLRAAIEKARSASMPKDNIERAIKKGTGELGGEQIEELYYEAIGPGNSQFVIKCVTDNKNRSAGNVRHIFTKNGGVFGNVLWNFEQKGVIMIENSELDAKKINFDDLELELIDAGIDDLLKETEGLTIYTKIDKLQAINSFLESKGLKVASAEIEYVAKEKQELKDNEKAIAERIMEALEDNEDVSDYYTNII